MSEQKPKKDLRARLGRTISPNTPGAAPIAPPTGIAPPAAAPIAAPAASPIAAPAASPIAAPPIAAPAIAAKPIAAPAIAAPPIAAPVKSPFGSDIVAPPFARPAEPAKPEPRKRSADPFAAGPAASDAVRLVIEERGTEDPAAAGRARARNLVVIAIGIALGLVGGVVAGGMNGRNGLYNITVRDAHDVADTVEAASARVLEAQTHLDAIVASARGGADHHPTINYDEIAALHALANPLHAGAFSRKNYNRFDAATVDDLFLYDHDIQELFGEPSGAFNMLNTLTSGPQRRAILETTAAATMCPTEFGAPAIAAAAAASADTSHAQYAALISTLDDGTVQGSLGFAEQELDAHTHEPTGRVFLRAARTGPGHAFDRWTPGGTIGAAPGSSVIMLDGASSSSILGTRVGAFRTFAEQLEETRAIMAETIAVQQRLMAALANIRNLDESFSL
jgi:hypothetical protein